MISLLNWIEVYYEVIKYCENHGEHRELEQLISTHAVYSFSYACITQRRFELGEDIIGFDVEITIAYSKLLDKL